MVFSKGLAVLIPLFFLIASVSAQGSLTLTAANEFATAFPR